MSLPCWLQAPVQDRSARVGEPGAAYGFGGRPMAAGCQEFPAGLDGVALFLRAASQQTVADDPVPSGRAGARTRRA